MLKIHCTLSDLGEAQNAMNFVGSSLKQTFLAN